jgi:hypothetical protein
MTFFMNKIIYYFSFENDLFLFICVIHGFKLQTSCPSMPIEEQEYGLKITIISHNIWVLTSINK